MTNDAASLRNAPYEVPADGCVERLVPGPGGTGPLAGLRLVVKDNIEVAGASYSAGQPLFRNRKGVVTAPAVSTLVAAGAVLVAMGATDAGGFGVTTPGVRNPTHPRRVVGGSSGGCAALIAAGQADIGLGTDTGGSVRIPAACTGIWGLKPQLGAISTENVWPMAPGFDHVGLMAATIETLARAAKALVPGPEGPTRDLRVIGYCDGPGWSRDRASDSALSSALARAREIGLETTRLDLPSRAMIARSHAILVLDAAAKAHVSLSDKDRAALAPASRHALIAAEKLPASDIAEADAFRRRLAGQLTALMSRVCAILSPTLPIVPPRVGQRKIRHGGSSILQALTAEACMANLTGLPAICGPSGCLSLQLTGLGAGVFDIVPVVSTLFSAIEEI